MGKQILLLAVFMAFWGGGFAQPAKLIKAEQYFEEGNYRKAIPLYEEILVHENNPEVKARLAGAYRFLGNYKASAEWYAQIIGLPQSRPEDKYYYGLMLLRTGDCKGAERWFKDYLKYNPYDPRKKRLLNACSYLSELTKDQSDRVAISLPEFNSPNSELGPAYFGDGLIFSAFRQSAEEPTHSFLDLFQVAFEEKEGKRVYSAPQPFSGSIRTKFHEGIVTFNSEETEIYFTRTREAATHSPLEPEIHRLEIVTARRLPQGGWSNLNPLSFSSDDYSIVHPSLSSDGKRLYFSSDMPGGHGGKDLYLSFQENGRWGPPINLGPAVNTPDDEVFPFISPSGKLFFSSDGHLGLGGQDIFWTEEGYDGLWVLPHNLGAPFNSEADDFGIIFNSDEMEGYFTSNRSGGKGKDDIYYFRMMPLGTPVQVDVVDLGTSNPIPYAKVVNSCNGDTLLSGPEGRILIHLPQCCTLTGIAKGYQDRSLEACERKGELAADTLFIALALPPQQDAPSEVSAAPEPSYMEPSGQHSLVGVVVNQKSGMPVYQAEVKLDGLNCPAPRAVFTDRQGKFSFALEANCCYEVRIIRDNYFARYLDEQICATGSTYEHSLNTYLTPYASDPASEGEGMPVKMDPEANDFAFNPTSEEDSDNFAFRMNVYYDVGRSSVQKASVSELLNLLHLLKENPDIRIEISSHTDSQGDSVYNQELSQRRADAIVRYLISQGIEEDRLVARGYGESKLANGCADGVPCTEEEHQENRRTEFKVLGKVQ
ncbi:MAG: OmpA family protein [Phaeodactylibacter sp.]|nr:OmpA family protein [Phaeodactylibacter sp.]MCB9286957.1 OmpA family protein [Lewinellaceae bacterium]